MHRRTLLTWLLLAPPALAMGCRCRSEPSAVERALQRGAAWLWSQQDASGTLPSRTYGFMAQGQSTTPFALAALVAIPPEVVPVGSERLSRALAALLDLRRDGALGFAAEALDYPVYATSLLLSVLGTVRPPGWEEAAAPSIAWLRGQQFLAGRGWEGHPAQGGFGMGRPEPPEPPRAGHVDLSMTRRAIDALRAVGASADDPSLAEALAFVRRCRAPTGGFVYSPVDDALNKGERTEQGHEGYGSATTDGVLALHALDRDEEAGPSVDFLQGIHRTDVNPNIAGGPMAGFARAMRFYYRAGAAAAFAALGGPPGWRQGLIEATLAEQREDGRWQSDEALQKENDPIIATAFALSTLARCLP